MIVTLLLGLTGAFTLGSFRVAIILDFSEISELLYIELLRQIQSKKIQFGHTLIIQ